MVTYVPDPQKADGKAGTGSFAAGVPDFVTPIPNPDKTDGQVGTGSFAAGVPDFVTPIPNPEKTDGKLGTGAFAAGVPGFITPVPDPDKSDGQIGTGSFATGVFGHTTSIPNPGGADGQGITIVAPPAPAPPVDPVTVSPTAAAADLFGFFSFGPSGLTNVTFDTTVSNGGFDFEGDTDIVTMSFPNLTGIDPTNTQGGYLNITDCTSLTTLDMPVFLPNDGNTYALTGNALSAASVNQFLARCVANAGFVSGSIDLSGGTSSAPTGQGLTDKATLIGRGVTVTTN